jgi:pyruvate/2-oxoglutarate dehydrogenase complex dihydrolipoamide dehydrogenase (E3) component
VSGESVGGLRLEDEHDRLLVNRVHPADWTDPRPAERYDLVVLGAGTGGLVTAAIAAGLGARVALVERHLMGGDCLNVGCVPSKALLVAARAWSAARGAGEFGGPAAAGAGDFAAVMRRMRRLRAELSRHDSALRFRDELGVDVFLGEGRFRGPDSLGVNGATLSFRRAVIATGARAAVPPVPGLAEAGFLTNETVFGLAELPRRLVVLGAGPIGCELAQAFARFGSSVTVLDVADRILPNDDPDASRVVHAALARDGVTFRLGARATSVERRGDERIVRFADAGGEGAVTGDALLVATGRAPNADGLGLESAGVAHTARGVTVDDRLRTANPRIYAVGDVATSQRFTHAADAMARLVVVNALFFGRGRVSRLVVPWCTYTSPEVAHVGLSADGAATAGIEVETVTVPLDMVDRARLDGTAEGFCRVHVARSGRVVGATFVGEHAGEAIGEATLAVTRGLRIGALGATIHPYPTQAEAWRKAADAWRRRRFSPRLQAVVAAFLRLFR